MKRFRIGPDGKATFAIVQAEDELAAIGMVIGAGWAGARAMTATAGPGISLMTEFSGLAYYTEIPGVFFDIQRTGPSTGMPTRTQQGDEAIELGNGHRKRSSRRMSRGHFDRLGPEDQGGAWRSSVQRCALEQVPLESAH